MFQARPVRFVTISGARRWRRLRLVRSKINLTRLTKSGHPSGAPSQLTFWRKLFSSAMKTVERQSRSATNFSDSLVHPDKTVRRKAAAFTCLLSALQESRVQSETALQKAYGSRVTPPSVDSLAGSQKNLGQRNSCGAAYVVQNVQGSIS